MDIYRSLASGHTVVIFVYYYRVARCALVYFLKSAFLARVVSVPNVVDSIA